jgi:hypothetical protein
MSSQLLPHLLALLLNDQASSGVIMMLSAQDGIDLYFLGLDCLVHLALYLMIELTIRQFLLGAIFELLAFNIIGRSKTFRNCIYLRLSDRYCTSNTIAVI